MIAKEGRKIILILFFLTIFFRLVGNINGFEWLSFVYLISGLFFLFSLIFFRDPKRNIPAGDNSLVSPADGKIIKIEQVNDPDVGKGVLVSVFLNIFNVHVNIFQVVAEGDRPRGDLPADGLQARDDSLGLLAGDHALPAQHAGVRD